jgi:hypothetical protein
MCCPTPIEAVQRNLRRIGKQVSTTSPNRLAWRVQQVPVPSGAFPVCRMIRFPGCPSASTTLF